MASVVILMEVVVSMVTALQGREGGQEKAGRIGSERYPSESRIVKVQELEHSWVVWVLLVVSGFY